MDYQTCLDKIKLHLLILEDKVGYPLRRHPRPDKRCPIFAFAPDFDYEGREYGFGLGYTGPFSTSPVVFYDDPGERSWSKCWYEDNKLEVYQPIFLDLETWLCSPDYRKSYINSHLGPAIFNAIKEVPHGRS